MKKKEKLNDLLEKLGESIFSAKSSIQAAEKWMQLLAEDLGIETDALNVQIEKMVESRRESTLSEEEMKVIEGAFDGQNMIAQNGTKYPVPANYASKSKLIEGDGLKLIIQPTGAFVYKQISPVPRKLITGRLVLDGSQYQVLSEGKTYNVLYASVTFFRAHVGDTVTIVVPVKEGSNWAAIENILPDKPGNDGFGEEETGE